MTVYVVPEPEILPAVPLVTVMSPAINPVTASLKVIVTRIGKVLVGLGAVDVIVTVGEAVSNVLLNCEAAVLLLPVASIALPAATFTVTVPCAVGVTFAVYVVPDPERPATVPLVTEMSPVTNPVTASLKVIVTGIGDELVGFTVVEVMVTEGETVSYVLLH